MSNVTDFDELCKKIDAASYEVLNQAHQEYASDEDRFANFRTVATFLKLHPKLADIELDELALIVAWVYRLKHIISELKGISLRESMLGRTIDDINYGKLIAGLMDEIAKKRDVTVSNPAKLVRIEREETTDTTDSPPFSEEKLQEILDEIRRVYPHSNHPWQPAQPWTIID